MRPNTRALMATAIATLSLPGPAVSHWTPDSPVHLRRHAVNLAWCGGTEKWCADGYEAWSVSGCEAGPQRSPWARNGIYLGMFQVSIYWRRIIRGFAMNAWAQAKHAHRVWTLTGRSWAHWSCKP